MSHFQDKIVYKEIEKKYTQFGKQKNIFFNSTIFHTLTYIIQIKESFNQRF